MTFKKYFVNVDTILGVTAVEFPVPDENLLDILTMRTCSVCKKRGTKGFFRIPNDYRQNAFRTVANLPALAANEKTPDVRRCFHHFQVKDLVVVGNQVRLSKGKN